MSVPIYFIEGVEAAGPDLVAALGLDYALTPSCSVRLAGNGPGGTGGAACSLSVDGLGFFPERQVWRDFGLRDGKRVWFGHATGNPPGPDDLKTPKALPGDAVKLFDDREWTIPQAIACQNGSLAYMSPAAAKRKPEGWFRGDVKPSYRRFEEFARQFWDWRVAPSDAPNELTAEQLFDWAVESLSLNYRVSVDEINTLGLLDFNGSMPLAILDAVVDYRSFVEFSQKKSG